METGTKVQTSANLKKKPWMTIAIQEQIFLVKGHFTASSYEFVLANYVNMWYESLDTEDVKKRCQKLNPSVEAPVAKVLEHISQQLEGKSPGVTHEIAFKNGGEGEERVLFSVAGSLAGLPFTWRFRGLPVDRATLAVELTLPVTSMVGELLRRQRQLMLLLVAKDREIEDFRTQGHTVTRKHIETPIFDERGFRDSMLTSKEFEHQVALGGRHVFEGEGRDIYRAIAEKEHATSGSPAKDGAPSLLSAAPHDTPGAAPPSWASRLPPSLSPASSPAKSGPNSPTKSPAKSPARPPVVKTGGAATATANTTEQLRRAALERKLADEEAKKTAKPKKKKLKL